jgi:flagellar hook-associated protein 1 FlgK
MLNSLMSIGESALNAAQAWIAVTGNNLANTDTEGYSRQYVDQRDAVALIRKPGAQGMGVNVQQVLRFFDAFLERSYVDQYTTSSRWNEHNEIMASLENLFNESNRAGVSSAMNNFFNAWNDLALRPDDTATRVSLLSFADGLTDMVRNTMDGIRQIQREMDVSIHDSVDRVNALSKSIADLNNQINLQTVKGVSNPNSLLDKRDQMVRELATLVDVETYDRGLGDFRVQLTTGQPLVDGISTFELRVMGPQAETRPQLPPSTGMATNARLDFGGSDDHEYTVEIVTGGNVGATPQFRVSLDGGRTWLRDEDGQELRFDITDKDGDGFVDPVLVKDLKISFSDPDSPVGTPGVMGNLRFNVGDRFDVVPKDALYWIEPTRGPENVTPQKYFDGTDNQDRVTGGKLAAAFNIRDDNCGRYIDELDAVISSLIWETNRVHSQGAGLKMLDFAQGQQAVGATDMPLGSPQAMLPWANRLQAGNVNMHFYNKTTGDHVASGMLDFDGSQAGVQNFDPAVHTLEYVAQVINNGLVDSDGLPITPPQPLLARIVDGKLLIESTDPDISFAMGEDSSGLLAALGLNSFFTGDSAANLAVNSALHTDTDLIASGQVNAQVAGSGVNFYANAGDPVTAKNIGKLAEKNVSIYTFWKTTTNQSLSQYYATLVSTVGADKRQSQTNAEYNTAISDDLLARVTSVTGVNMDEEMSNLIKYQHAYTAAAKMITTADQMLQTLLGLKQ